jgi:hypothetical protein
LLKTSQVNDHRSISLVFVKDISSTAWIFLLHFQLPYLPEETCFQQAGSSMVEGTSQAVLGSSDQQKVPARLSLFLNSEKIPTLLYIGKGPEYRPLHNFQLVPSAYGPPA